MTTSTLSDFEKIQKEGFELFQKKNKDYGESYKQFGYLGILVRLQDKINRCLSVNENKIECIRSESLRDTLIDMHNYSALAIMLLDKNQKKNMYDLSEEDFIRSLF